MPNVADALKDLAELIGLLGESDIHWTWFGGPAQGTLQSIYANRDQLAALIHDLADTTDGKKEDFQAALKEDWKPFLDKFAKIGVVWSDTTAGNPLKLGIGAKAGVGPGDLSVVAWLFDITQAGAAYDTGSLAGTGECVGTLQLAAATKFLESVSIDAPIPQIDKVALTVTGSTPANAKPQKVLSANTPQRAWDLVRLAAFILGQFIRERATEDPPSALFTRLSRHLLPLLGDNTLPGDPIKPLPAFQDMGAPPDFTGWLNSIKPTSITPADNPGTLAFLWHLRALLTGNEDAQLLQGSLFAALTAPPPGAPSGGTVPSFPPLVPLAFDHDQLLVGVRFDGAPLPATVVARQIKAGNPAPIDVPLFQITAAGLAAVPLAPPAGTFTAGPVTYDSAAHVLTLKPDVSAAGIDFAIEVDVTTGAVRAALTLAGTLTVKIGAKKGPSGFAPSLDVTLSGSSLDPVSGTLALLRALLSDATGTAAKWLDAISSALSGDLVHGIPQLMAAVLAAQGQKNFQIPAGPLTFTLSFDPKPRLDIEALIPVKGSVGPIYLGAIDTTVGIALPLSPLAATVDKVQVKLTDLRVNPAGDNGLAASLLPDFLSIDGASLTISGPPIDIKGGGRVHIQRKLGPLDLESLLVEVDNHHVALGLDASFDLAGLTVATQDLGLSFDFKTGSPSVTLKGLGLSADFGGIKLAGAFGNVNGDYLGAASVSVFDTFQLSAVGGYTQLPDKSASLFLFAALNAPLGGPPFCFVTGIAGGFGYNRRLPKLGSASDNPFMQVMRGEIKLSDPKGGIGQYLDELADNFGPQEGSFWIAAGLQFTSFAFINGKVLATIAFNPFALNILGSAGFGIESLAYFELEFSVGVDSEKFLLIAGLTHNSYLIDPGLFGMSGQFGLGVWHSGEHAGDFVVSIGGYHPCYPPPSHYPKLDRVEVRAVLWDFVHITVSCFFACTPRELMAGASVSLWAEFIVKAGLDVYIDVYIRWDPFFLRARMGICVWFEFCGRHELGVDLDIHTPPFGGVAHIDLFLISFDVSFGSDADGPPPLPVADFVKRHLRLPVKTGATVKVPAYAKGGDSGLWRVDLGWGRATAPQATDTDQQEGLSTSAPILINAEFGLVIRTRLPILAAGDVKTAAGRTFIEGELHLPLCALADIKGCTLGVKLLQNGSAVLPKTVTPLVHRFPASQFGDEFDAAQADGDGREAAVRAGAVRDPTVDGTDVLTLDFPATLQPPAAAGWSIVTNGEPDKADARAYPLPLAARPRGTVVRHPGWPIMTTTGHRYRMSAGAKPRRLVRGPAAPVPVSYDVREAAVPAPLRLRTALSRGGGGGKLPDGTPLIAAPRSPVRRKELDGVVLRWVPPQTRRPSPAVGRLGLGRLFTGVRRQALARLPVRQLPSSGALSVAVGRVLHLELAKGSAAAGSVQLAAAPDQTVRAIFLGAYGRVTGDLWRRGPGPLQVPPGTRRLALIGEQPDAPVFGAGPTAEPMGLEGATPALALEGTTFAAHGCTVRISAGHEAPVPALMSVPGTQVLQRARSLEVRFAAPTQGAAVIVLRAVAPLPAPAGDQVRWRGLGSPQPDGAPAEVKLGAPRIVTRDALVALVLPATAGGPWTLELEVGRDYRVESIAALSGEPAALAEALSRAPRWTFIDEHYMPDAAAHAATPRVQPGDRTRLAEVRS